MLVGSWSRWIAGLHRLQAARRLGWDYVQVCFVEGSDDEFRLWEIAENLHRSELTPLERSAHITEWVRLTNKKLAQDEPASEQEDISRQVDAKLGRPEGGARLAARTIGVSESEVRRAAKIDAIAPEAKQAARDAGLDMNQSALLKVATARKDEQVEAVKRIVAEKREKREAPRAVH